MFDADTQGTVVFLEEEEEEEEGAGFINVSSATHLHQDTVSGT